MYTSFLQQRQQNSQKRKKDVQKKMEREMKQVWFSPPTNPPWEQMDYEDYGSKRNPPTIDNKTQTIKVVKLDDEKMKKVTIETRNESPSNTERKLNDLRSPRIRTTESRSRIFVEEKRQPPSAVPELEQKQTLEPMAISTNTIADKDVPRMFTADVIKGKKDFDNRVDTFADSIGQCATDCGKCKLCRANTDKCRCVIL